MLKQTFAGFIGRQYNKRISNVPIDSTKNKV